MDKLRDILFGLEGRIGRGTWWVIRIFGFLIVMSVCLSFTALTPEKKSTTPLLWVFAGFATVFGATGFWIDLATTVKRWHDRGHSGWMYLIRLIPIVGPIWTLVECGFFPGDPGRNRFGSPPDASPADPDPVTD